MLVALYNRTFQPEDVPTLQRIIQKLEGYDLQLIFYSDFYERIKSQVQLAKPAQFVFSGRLDLPEDTDMVISFGGDLSLIHI